MKGRDVSAVVHCCGGQKGKGEVRYVQTAFMFKATEKRLPGRSVVPLLEAAETIVNENFPSPPVQAGRPIYFPRYVPDLIQNG